MINNIDDFIAKYLSISHKSEFFVKFSLIFLLIDYKIFKFSDIRIIFSKNVTYQCEKYNEKSFYTFWDLFYSKSGFLILKVGSDFMVSRRTSYGIMYPDVVKDHIVIDKLIDNVKNKILFSRLFL